MFNMQFVKICTLIYRDIIKPVINIGYILSAKSLLLSRQMFSLYFSDIPALGRAWTTESASILIKLLDFT